VIPLELFRLLGTIAINNSKANDALDETSDKGEKSEKRLSKSFGKIAASAVTIGTAVTAAAVAAGTALVAIAEKTREYRSEMGKLEAAYLTAGHSAEVAKNTYSALHAVLGETDQAVEAANHLAKLVDNEKDLQKWTNICTGVYATFGASLPIEGLTEAANETAKTGTLTGQLADALNWAGVAEDEFQASLDACSTEQQRQALITKTLNKLYSEAAEKYKEVNKDVLDANAAQDKLNEGMAALGEIIEPVITAFKYFAGEVLLEMAKAIQTIIDKGKKLVERFNEIKKSVSETIDKIEKFLGFSGKSATITANTRLTATGTAASVRMHAAGGILTKPTIFGYTPSTDTYHLGGEAGAEAIAPIDKLQGYVKEAVAEENAGQNSLLQAILTVLQAILDKDTAVYLDNREITKAVNKGLGGVF
jgi:hypothetical protein